MKPALRRIRANNSREVLNEIFETIPDLLYDQLHRVDGCGQIMMQDLPMNSFDLENVRSIEIENLTACELVEQNPLNIKPTCFVYAVPDDCTATPYYRIPTHPVGVGAVDVYFDGYKLIADRDYIEIDENYVRILQTAPAGTRIEFVVYSSDECTIAEGCVPVTPSPTVPETDCDEAVLSEFTIDSENWTVTSGNLLFDPTLEDIYTRTTTTSLLTAPAAFRGNLSIYDAFSIDVTLDNSVTPTDTLVVYLTGPSGTASYDTGVTPSGTLTNVSVDLDGIGWTVTGDWGEILSNVTQLQVTAYYSSGSLEQLRWDNPKLNPINSCCQMLLLENGKICLPFGLAGLLGGANEWYFSCEYKFDGDWYKANDPTFPGTMYLDLWQSLPTTLQFENSPYYQSTPDLWSATSVKFKNTSITKFLPTSPPVIVSQEWFRAEMGYDNIGTRVQINYYNLESLEERLQTSTPNPTLWTPGDTVCLGEITSTSGVNFRGLIRNAKLIQNGVVLGEWPLTSEYIDGTTVLDISGNGNHGTLTIGDSTWVDCE